MTDSALATLRLLQIGDSAFPSGAFAFSNGLETLVADRRVVDSRALEGFLRGQVIARWAGMDRWFTRKAHGMAASADSVTELDRLCEAHVAIEGLGVASRRVGLAMLTTHERIGTPGAAAYAARVRSGEAPGHAAIVQAVVGTGMALSVAATEAAALYGAVNGTLTAAIRLGIIGALAAQRLLAGLADAMAAVLAGDPPAVPAAFTPLADIAVSRHAGGPGRLFSS